MSNSKGGYPRNKDQFKNSNSKPDVAGQAINEFLHEAIVVSAIGFWTILKSLFSRYCPLTLVSIALTVWVGYYISTEALHIRFIHELEPSLFTYKRLSTLYQFHRNWYWFGISTFIYFLIVVVVGIYTRSITTKYQAIFHRMGLRNGVGDTPKFLAKNVIDSSRTKYIFDANGTGLSEFEAKKERLESHFKENVESITYGKNKGRVEISFNKNEFPKLIKYKNLLKEHTLPDSSFFVGHSTEGIITQNIAKLPHMMIAGVTDSGKSVFFKQALLGLLESTPHLQMYLIDLKGGLEMIDFVKAPNVRVVKTMEEALKVLRQVEREMKERFKYLEKSGKKIIIPERDKKERIVLAVDEASVLYMNRGAHDADKQNALEARKLADSIAKLSRAASIHLLLATQKLQNQVIPTSVTENISGRMMFRANSFQGSNQVLGSKAATELPEIPGRGIWNFGIKKLMIQAPFIDEKTITDKCIKIAEEFKTGKRKHLNPMIGEVEKKKGQDKQDIAYELVDKKNDSTSNEDEEEKKDD